MQPVVLGIAGVTGGTVAGTYTTEVVGVNETDTTESRDFDSVGTVTEGDSELALPGASASHSGA